MLEPQSVKELVAAFQQMGGDAKEALVWYLLIARLPAYIIGLAWTGIGFFVLSHVIRMVRSSIAGERIRQAIGINSWSQSNIDAACQLLKKHARNRND